MPKKRRQGRRRIMVIGSYWEERLLAGVAEVAHQERWILDAPCRHESVARTLPKDWRGDGVIAITHGDRRLAKYVQNLGVPVVLAQEAKDIPGCPTVMHEEIEVGRVAAEHLLSAGFERFVFVAPKAVLATSRRGAGFENCVAKAGKSCRRIALESFTRELPRLAPPTAIFAANDVFAQEVANRLRLAGRTVPGEFALLGVDDDHILCLLGETPLSSVNLDFEGRGRRCAELLDRMMRCGKVAPASILTPLRGVSARESTDTHAIPHPVAASALRFLRENYRRPIALDDLRDALGVPLRGIGDIFKKHTGGTFADELARLRREAALKALRNTGLKLQAVALDCGYSGAQHLSRALLRETGLTPQAWRRRWREG